MGRVSTPEPQSIAHRKSVGATIGRPSTKTPACTQFHHLSCCRTCPQNPSKGLGSQPYLRTAGGRPYARNICPNHHSSPTTIQRLPLRGGSAVGGGGETAPHNLRSTHKPLPTKPHSNRPSGRTLPLHSSLKITWAPARCSPPAPFRNPFFHNTILPQKPVHFFSDFYPLFYHIFILFFIIQLSENRTTKPFSDHFPQ